MRASARIGGARQRTLRRAVVRSALTAALAGLVVIACPSNSPAAEPHPQLTVIEAEAILGKGQEFKDACGVAADAGDYIYVADYYRNRVTIFHREEIAGQLLFQQVGGIANIDPLDAGGVLPIDGPCDLAVDSAHNLYVNDYHRDVVKFTPSVYPPLGATYSRETIDSGESTGVAVDPLSDEVYVDDRDHVNVYPAGPSAGTPPSRVVDLGPGADAYGAAVSGFAGTAHRLYVTDAATDAVRVFGPAGEPVEVIDGAGDPLDGFVSLVDSDLTVDPVDGHLYVVDDLRPHLETQATGGPEAIVYEFSPEGHYRGRIPAAEGQPSPINAAEPSGLAIDSEREIFVTSGNRYEAGVFRPLRSQVLVFGAAPATATHLLSVLRTGPGAGTVVSSPFGLNCGSACVGEFETSEMPVLTAAAETGSRFAGWSGCPQVLAAGGCRVPMSADRTVTAEFEEFPQRTLTVVKQGTGFGAVHSVPAGIECGSACAAEFDQGATVALVELTAPPNRFAGWSGCDSEPEPGLCRVTMNADRSVSPSFELAPVVEEEEATSPRPPRPPVPAVPTLPQPAAPSLRIHSVTVKGAKVTISISVPGPGELSAAGRGLSDASRVVLRRGDATLALHRHRGGRGRQRSLVTVDFVPFLEGPSLHARAKAVFGRKRGHG
jgi:DNA-binding beta-propeller fold protein YncE